MTEGEQLATIITLESLLGRMRQQGQDLDALHTALVAANSYAKQVALAAWHVGLAVDQIERELSARRQVYDQLQEKARKQREAQKGQ